MTNPTPERWTNPPRSDAEVARQQASPPQRAAGQAGLPVDPTATASGSRIVSVFSGVRRRGHWVVPDRLDTVTLFAGTELDLRHATLTAPVTDITVVCAFGGLEVVVPEGVRVVSEMFVLFGGASETQQDPGPDAPTIRLHGVCLFGGVDVKVKARKAPENGPLR